MEPSFHGKTIPPALMVLAGSMLLASLGISIVAVALPALARAFSAPVFAVQWVVLAYLISVTVVIVLAGKLGDLIGHRRVLMIGLMLFAIASLFCAAASTLGMLVAGRVMQGIGGATLMALPLSIARDVVIKERLGSAMGLFGTISAIGTALGPSLGGALVTAFGWRAVFVLLAVLSACAWGLVAWVIPVSASRSIASAHRVDWLGAVLLTTALVLYAFAIVGGESGVALESGLLWVIASVMLALFILAESRAASPLVPMAQLRDRVTGVSLVTNLLVSTVMMTTLVVGPFFLVFSLGLNETSSGLVIAVGPLVAALSGVPAGRMTDRFGARNIQMLGLLQMTIGLVCLACLPRLLDVAGYVLALMVLTPGFQLFLAANTTTVMLGAADAQRGMLSGLLGLSRNLGFIGGASVMSGLFAAAVGSQSIADSAPEDIAKAFTVTFLVAAGLGGLSIALVLCGRARQEARQHL